MPPKNSKKVAVKTQTSTYSAVRLSMVVMTAVAMVSAGIIGGALLVAALPKTQIIKNVTPAAAKSADGAVLGEVLVRFKAGTSELARVQAVKAALNAPVNVTTLQSVKKRVGLRTVTQTVETVSKKVVSYKSLQPVVEPTIKLTGLAFATRQNRGTSADVQAAADTLTRWYVLRIDPPTADLGQVVTALGKQASIEKAEQNRYVQAAAVTGVSTGTAGSAIKLSGAQTAAYVASGDCNADKVVDAKDLRVLIDYMINKGPKPTSLSAADVNRDGRIDIADISALVVFLYPPTTSANYADLTGDGSYNETDVNFLSAYITAKGPAPTPLSAADYDKDGKVDLTDLSMAVNYVFGGAAGTTTYGVGDVNTDGVIDNRDLDYLIAYILGKGPAPSPLSLGDMDADGTVDLTDLTYFMSMLYTEANTVNSVAVSAGSATTGGPISSADGGTVQPVISPTFLLGDSNADSRVNAADIRHMAAYLYQKGPAPSPLSRGDFTGDGVIDISDFSRLVQMVYDQLKTRVALADLNSDGKVDVADLTYLSNYLVGKGPAPEVTKADIDSSGNVDLSDLSILGQYVYQTQTPPVCADVRTVGSTAILTGDVNGSGSVTKADLVALGSIVYANAALPAIRERADINCDGLVDATDVLALNARLQTNVLAALPGDANHDGAVTPQDIAASTSTPSDVNRDGTADIRDTYSLVRLLKLNTTTRSLPDVNGDGAVNWTDADALLQGTFTSGAATLGTTADVNGDGTVDPADAFTFVDVLRSKQSDSGILAGDANADNVVDCRDVQYLHATYFANGTKPTPMSRADVSKDGTANVADLILLAKRTCPALGAGSLANDVTIAVVDSGISTTLTETKATIAKSKETVTNSKDDDGNGYVDDVLGYNVLNSAAVSVDCNGHGTALARMLSTKTGVASQSKVIPVKALDCKGRGYASGIARGLVYANVRGADIALLPFSGYGTSTLLADVVKYTKASGMFVVAAAGNDRVSISRVFPANVAGVFSVGATSAGGTAVTSYSNTGATVTAPGNATGVSLQGTSVSATYVAGTAALTLAKNPTLTLSQLTTKLTPKVTTTNPKTLKLLDAQAALGQ